MSMIRNASLNKVSDLIGGRGNYVKIPPFQRSFSWTGDQAKDLFDDINRFVNNNPGRKMDDAEYFLGAIVAFPEGRALELIDGQQRIASLTILLSCIRDKLEPLDQTEANKLHFDLIQEQVRRGQIVNKLTLNQADQDYFSRLIQKFPRGGRPKATLASHKKIQQVKNKFDGDTCLGKELKGKTDVQKIDYLCDLTDAISNNLTLVLVETESVDGASDVFEVLNERGLGLSTVDLVRNFLLSKAANKEQIDAIVLRWSVVLAISDNATKIQNFLRHYWIVRYGDVKARGLYRIIKEQLRKEFRSRSTTALKFSEELADSAQNYQSLLDASTDSADLNEALSTVSKLDATPIYPVLLATIEQTDELETLKVCQALISHYVRWTIIGRRESTVLETQLFDLAQHIHKGLAINKALDQIREFSLEDEVFEEEFALAQLTKAGQRRPILDALENRMRTDSGKDELRPDEALHVEHIYPQSPDKTMKLDDHDDWVNRIGNLTLLTGSKNSRIGNRDFRTVKLPVIQLSLLEINEYVMRQKSWGPEQIEERQRILASYAPRVWPLPPAAPVKRARKSTPARKAVAKKAAAKKTTKRTRVKKASS